MEQIRLSGETSQDENTSAFAEEIKEHWPYQDFSFEEWEENGFLLTGEGLPSKLDRESYDLVRSPEFKEWFGDWETADSGEVSVFTDEQTGEPQVFYRGDKSRFKERFLVKSENERTLDPNKNYSFSEAAPIAGARSQGVFFTDSKEVALDYGKDISAETLGKYGLDEAADHPETFPEMVAFVRTIARDVQFWRQVVRNRVHFGGGSEVAKRQFDENWYFSQLPETEREQLWKTVTNEQMLLSPAKMLDSFIHMGAFEWLVSGYLHTNYSNPHDSFSSESHSAYGSWSEYAPESSRRLNDILVRYKTEPLVLSRSFLHATNPKEGPISTYGFEVHDARLAGHDAYIHHNGVGNSTADEVIIFEPNNIWTVSKEPLSQVVHESNYKRYKAT